MKLALKFVAIRVGRHVEPSTANYVSESLRFIPLASMDPKHDDNSHKNAVAVWPHGVNGELTLNYVDPEIVKNIDAGTVIGVTLEIPD